MMDEVAPAVPHEPPDEFWEDDLEMPIAELREKARSDDFMAGWLEERNGAQVAMLRHLLRLGPDAPPRGRKKELHDYLPDLRRFVPVHGFARHKLKAAVVDFAERRLSRGLLELARAGESYDAAALIYAAYDNSWPDLALVYQLDKIHRKGFARMRLAERLRRPAAPLAEFLDRSTVQGILAAYDRETADGRVSQFKGHIPHNGTDLVCIRRSERPSLLMRGGELLHGFAPEWIILDFRQGAARVHICSESIRPSVEIANAIATAYHGVPCEYENDRIATYPRQLRRLLDGLMADDARGLRLMEARVRDSPLDTGPKLTLSAQEKLSIAPAVRRFDRALGPLLADLRAIEAIKVLFRGKRVKLIFDDGSEDDDPLPASGADPDDRPFVVRYTDHVLTAAEREEFEQLMDEAHGITVVSTEKRFRS